MEKVTLKAMRGHSRYKKLTKQLREENFEYILSHLSASYTLNYSYKIGLDVINSDGLVCDAGYLNPFDHFKQWYTPYEKKEGNQLSG